MNYELVKSNENDIPKLIEYKKRTIFEYANNLSETEKKEIIDYINKSIVTEIDNYFNIIVNKKVIGCILLTDKDDGKLIDELYLETEYRSHGIGSDIIKNILDTNKKVYLWVYKANKDAIRLYKKLGFYTNLETKTRIYMQYNS